jgi:predicted homoserine dehydrogenase-like protein
MIIVDTALEEREKANNPIRVGLIGAGYMGRGIVLQIEEYLPGMRVAAISNRTLHKAEQAYIEAGVEAFEQVSSVEKLEEIVPEGGCCVTNDPMIIASAGCIDAVIEATGAIEFSVQPVLKAIQAHKHVILMNAELDATVGPMLKVYADRSGVVLSNADGDQPGVMMNLYRFVKSIGYNPVLLGNIKGLQDYYRTPDTQKAFAEKHNLTPKMATAFADGTKISMENAIVANATGFRAGKRGMYGPRCAHANEAPNLFPAEEMLNGGMVDYILGAEPGPGVFAIGHNDHPLRRPYMTYFKMGDGPFYTFYTPYHLPHLEVPLTVARAVLFNDAAVTPLGRPVCDVITIAKRNLQAGELLDGVGGFTCYGVIENSSVCHDENLLPMGLSEDCRLKCNIKKDTPIKYDDVERPKGHLVGRLRKEQDQYFNK